jgi:glycosyltransferase involved in cell wall biosynthesis
MSLLFINTTPIWGGGELWTLETASEFKSRNIPVATITSKNSQISERLQRAGIETISIPAQAYKHLLQLKNLHYWIKKQQPDIVLTNSGTDLRLAVLLNSGKKKYSIIYRRGLDKKIKSDLIHKLLFKQVDCIITNSLATMNTVSKSLSWYNPKDIHTIYNPINVESFLNFTPKNIRQKLNIGDGKKVIGIIGRLSKQKGHKFLFLALKTILQTFSDVILLVVGDGELRRSLQSLASQLQIDKNCIFTGYVKEVQPYYAACDMIAIPSIFEGFCYTAIEAQIMQKPIVASDVSSIPEVCRDKETTFLFPRKDVNFLTASLIKLINNPKLATKMGLAGKQFVSTHFSAETTYNQLEQLFELYNKNNRKAEGR